MRVIYAPSTGTFIQVLDNVFSGVNHIFANCGICIKAYNEMRVKFLINNGTVVNRGVVAVG